ncbi:hypothetical protein NBRC116492_14680 [Aurantivibrio infirmus]
MASVDTQSDNKRFAKEQKAKFPLLCDPAKEMTQAYGVLSPRGFANRWTIYIDKEGVVQKIDQKVKPNSAGKDMLDAFEELDFAKK